MNDISHLDEIQRPDRPTFLKVLCILSFISIGFGVLSSLSSVFSGPQSDDDMVDAQVQLTASIDEMRASGADGFANFFEKLKGLLVDTNDHHALATSIGIFVISLGLFAVLRMWQGQRIGFFLYIAYSLAGSFSVYLYVSPNHIPLALPIISLVFSGIFIFMYSRNLHWMR